jgi:hypothetical protein
MSGISFTRHHRWRRIFDGNISGQSPCLHHQGIVVLLKPSRLQHTLSARTSVCVCTTLGYRTFHFTPTLPSIPSLASTALAKASRRVMSQQHQQGDSTIIEPFPKPRSSDDEMSSSTNNEKSSDAEAGLQPQKPPGGSGPPGGPPPNGGLTAWLQVLGGFFLFFNTWVSGWLLLVYV